MHKTKSPVTDQYEIGKHIGLILFFFLNKVAPGSPALLAAVTFFPQKEELDPMLMEANDHPCTLMVQHKCLGEDKGRNCDSKTFVS